MAIFFSPQMTAPEIAMSALRICPLMVLFFLLPVSHADEWVASTGTGCQVAVPGSAAGATFRWQGGCAAGKAQGKGILTSSHGGLLQGDFKDGLPFTTWGFWPLAFNDGGAVMAQHQVTDGGAPFWNTLELPEEQGKPGPADSAPLAGDWDFVSGDGKCRERHSYHADGSYVSRSGEEVMEGAFAVMQLAGNPKVLGFLRSAIAANGKRDCSGQRAPREPERTDFFYVVPETPDRFAICRVTKSPLRCIGTFTRATSP